MKQVLYRYRFFIACLLLLVTGGIILQYINNLILQQEEEKRQIQLEGVHENTKSLIANQIENLATLTAGIGSYIKYADSLPKTVELKTYVEHLINHLDYEDAYVISFVDTSFNFISTFSKTENDPANLVGTSVAQFRTKDELDILRRAMKEENIVMFEPFNLVEGWPGVVMHFGIHRNGKPVGFIAPIINLEYILKGVYQHKNTSEFVHRFQTSQHHYFDRYAVYDGNEIFNDDTDPEYWERTGVNPQRFISSQINVYGYNMTIGTAYKTEVQASFIISFLMYLWLLILAIFISFVIWQMTRSNKLAKRLELARAELERLSIVASETENIVLIMDAEGNVEWVNQSFERLNQLTTKN
ncbi:MAG: hypothetical protein JKY54_05845 [Flavobacteriales bacterium]|nr:hypothetical protein [Flavobacteriales bacterium]